MSAHPEVPPDVKAAELCRFFTLSEEGSGLLQPEMVPEEFVLALTGGKRHPDAVQVIAHYLPKRQGVFWALTSVRQAFPNATPEVEAALKAAEHWIAEPNEPSRTAALRAAEVVGPASPAGCTALAAYYSDGLPRTEDPRTNARAHFLSAKLVASAVLLSATAAPEAMQDRFESFVSRGLEFIKKSRRA